MERFSTYIFNFNSKIFLILLLILFSLIIFLLEAFLDIDLLTYRQWEARSSYIPNGPQFIPNKISERYEFLDRYRLENFKNQNKIKKSIWITDEYGTRNDPSKTSLSSAKLFFIGDSNYIGSSFTQNEIISEVFTNQYNISSYVYPYDLVQFFNLINKMNFIKYINVQSKWGDWMQSPSSPLTLNSFRIDNDCNLSLIDKKKLVEYNYINYLKSRINKKPLYQYIRSSLKIYNFPKKELISKNNNYINCKKKLPDHEIFDSNLPDISDKSLNIKLSIGQAVSYFYLANQYIYKYTNDKNINYSYLLMPETNLPSDFYIAANILNNQGIKVFIFNKEIGESFWQLYDSHWKSSSVKFIAKEIYEDWINEIESINSK